MAGLWRLGGRSEYVSSQCHISMMIRADCDPYGKFPVCWIPACDFSDVFKFEDRREERWASVADIWERAEEEHNIPWQHGSGKPLYRCTLIQIVGGYCILNCYHHAVGITSQVKHL